LKKDLKIFKDIQLIENELETIASNLNKDELAVTNESDISLSNIKNL